MTTSVSERGPHPSVKSERLMARISSEQKRLLQPAADIRGQTLTEFVVMAAQEAATRAIVDQEVIEVSLRDSGLLPKACSIPPPVNNWLRAAAKRYKNLMES